MECKISMKLRSMLVATALLGSLAVGQASASYRCGLQANPSYVPVGTTFSYSVVLKFADFSPLPPPSVKPFTVVFFGTGIGSAGETYPQNIPGNYVTVLPGYGNPGGISGNYTRFVKIYENGQFLCQTAPIIVTLQ